MDAQRTRRTRDQARKSWYAHYRQIRFARWFGFIEAETDLNSLFQRVTVSNKAAEPRPDSHDDSSTATILDGAISGIC